ncbi:MAG: NADH:ubiquinone reductase (Na(+)-transporting) subunit C [Verrucomicrobia bacterium]|nr:NADH:ubiquinone reductase (Na(+)-transporting) subunit C [Verrucomicrobiota bacterium]
MGKELKVIGFAAAVCLICSLLLAATYSKLHLRQEENKALDMKKKVLVAFGVELTDASGKAKLSGDEISELFDTRIEGKVLDAEGNLLAGKSVNELSPDEINKRDKETKLKTYYPYYVYSDPATGTKLFGIHASGMGLWSVVKSYVALEDDYGTISGIAFYDHAETPGLGGEIEKDWFQDQFKGKKLFADGSSRYFKVVKPGMEVDESSVNGPTGATMTSNGITDFMNKDFAVYNKHFANLRK